MKRIKKNLSTEASRKFWESFPKDEGKPFVLPYLGDAWWLTELETSASLLTPLNTKNLRRGSDW